MVSQEVISFIQEQVEDGRDVRTIRNYLLSRGLNQQEVDAAFDKVFRAVAQSKVTSKSKHSTEKIVVGGIALILILLMVVAFSLYKSITPTPSEGGGGTTTLTPPDVPLDKDYVCGYEDTEQKYQCYVSLFEQGDFYCYEIEDDEEREFCYRTKDLYVLSA